MILPALNDSNVLDRLRAVQSTLDLIDISSLAARFQQEHPGVDLFDTSIAIEPSPQELEAFIEKYASDPGGGSTGCWSLREHMVAYALSAIFKDCSIFVTLPVSSSTGEVMSGAKVKVIDLDLKSVGSLKKWYDLDEAIWRHWYGTNVRESPMGDSLAVGGTIHPVPTPAIDEVSSVVSVPPIPVAEVQASTPPTDGRFTPTRSETRDPALLAPRTPQSMSFVDALAISPSKPTSDDRDPGHSLGVTAPLVTPRRDSLLPPPQHLAKEVDHDQMIESGDMNASVTDMVGTDLKSLQDYIEPIGADQGIATIDDLELSEEGIESRKKRSFAPSPSPTRSAMDLPEDLKRILAPVPQAILRSQHEDGAMEPNSAQRSVKENSEPAKSFHTLSSQVTTQQNEVILPELGSSTKATDNSVLPEAVEMLREESKYHDTSAGSSGTSTPFQEFSTPMTDTSEPMLRVRTLETAASETSPRQLPSIETTSLREVEGVVVEDAGQGDMQRDSALSRPETVGAVEHAMEESVGSGDSDLEVSDRTFGQIDEDAEDHGEQTSLAQVLFGAPMASLPQLYAKEAQEEFSHLDDKKPEPRSPVSLPESLTAGPQVVDRSTGTSPSESDVVGPTSPALSSDKEDHAVELGRMAFANAHSPDRAAFASNLADASQTAMRTKDGTTEDPGRAQDLNSFSITALIHADVKDRSTRERTLDPASPHAETSSSSSNETSLSREQETITSNDPASSVLPVDEPLPSVQDYKTVIPEGNERDSEELSGSIAPSESSTYSHSTAATLQPDLVPRDHAVTERLKKDEPVERTKTTKANLSERHNGELQVSSASEMAVSMPNTPGLSVDGSSKPTFRSR